MKLQRLSKWLLFASSISFSWATVYTDPSQLTTSTYDYIIIGSGAGGGPVAARLTELENVKILVVEAGISSEGILDLELPLIAPTLTPHTRYDWNYTTTGQAGFNGRSVAYPRGKVLGGSTSVNYLVYGRGSIDDFNLYANISGDPGWSWDNMFPYALKTEKLVPPTDGHDTTGQFDPSLHSTTGVVDVSLYGFPTPLDPKVIATTRELPDQFPFTNDTIGGRVVGIGYSFAAIGNGTRSSAATAYLLPKATGNGSKLDILVNTQATKLLQTGTVGGKPSFHSVQVQQNATSKTFELTATREIVLSAGSIGTPALLQLSGIGDRAVLTPLGIKTIVHNPSVGQNMTDHVLVPNPFFVNSTETFDDIFRNTTVFQQNLEIWQQNKSTPLSADVCNTVGWLRVPSDDPIFQNTTDPSPGPNSAHYEFIFKNFFVDPSAASYPATGNFMSITTNLITPSSYGSVNITSSNPFDPPRIDPNFLSTEFDIHALVVGIKASRTFVSASPWSGYVLSPFRNLTTDSEVEQYIRNNASTVFHPVGTASMSPVGAKWGVVDPNLKVKGVEGLRIVDGSVIPYVPNAHTTAPIYMFAERGADLIKASIVDADP